jgi:hypothetical protein
MANTNAGRHAIKVKSQMVGHTTSHSRSATETSSNKAENYCAPVSDNAQGKTESPVSRKQTNLPSAGIEVLASSTERPRSTFSYVAEVASAHQQVIIQGPSQMACVVAIDALRRGGLQFRYEWDTTSIREAVCRLGIQNDGQIQELEQICTELLGKGLQKSLSSYETITMNTLAEMATRNSTLETNCEKVVSESKAAAQAHRVTMLELAATQDKMRTAQQELRNLKASAPATRQAATTLVSYNRLMADFRKVCEENEELQRLLNKSREDAKGAKMNEKSN